MRDTHLLERGETDNDTEDVGRSRRKGNVLVGSRQTCEGHTSTERVRD